MKRPAIVVRVMPGTARSWSDLHAYWRWECVCGTRGHWTSANYAHDDGRYHAKECGTFAYQRLAQRVCEIDATREVGDVGAAIHAIARAVQR
jgi:hypothetical protein